MSHAVLLEWEGREYDHVPKSADWYWALGIIAASATIAATLFGNYLLAVLIITATAALALHAAKVPPVHHFSLVDQGLVIGDELHPFDRMLSFSLLEDTDGVLPSYLSIKNASWVSPHLVIPLEGIDVEEVYAYFLQRVEEAEHKHTIADLVAAWLGF